MIEFEKPGDCPSGENCPVHFRVDREIRRDDEFLYSHITYVGEYCVMTGDNPAYVNNPLSAVVHMMEHGRLPDDCLATLVYRVGLKGTLYDIATSGAPLVPERTVPSGDLDAAQANHAITVSWVASL